MMFHDVFNAYVIVLRLQIIFALNRLNSSESSQINSNPSHESRIQQEIQLSERAGALIPQEQPEEETHPPSQPLHHQRIVQDTSTRTLQIMDKKSKVVKLTTLCT